MLLNRFRPVISSWGSTAIDHWKLNFQPRVRKFVRIEFSWARENSIVLPRSTLEGPKRMESKLRGLVRVIE